MQQAREKQYNCTSSTKQELTKRLFEQALTFTGAKIEYISFGSLVPIIVKNQIISGVLAATHSATCQSNFPILQVDWIEEFFLLPGSTESTVISLENVRSKSRVSIKLSPTKAQLTIWQYSSSGLEKVCLFNGLQNPLPFVLDGTVDGVSIQEAQYDCKSLTMQPAITLPQLLNNTTEINSAVVGESIVAAIAASRNATIPQNCFTGIQDKCLNSSSNIFTCSGNIVADDISAKAVKSLGSFSLANTLVIDGSGAGIVSTVTHSSICNFTTKSESTWVETIQISTTSNRSPNTTFGVVVIERTPTYTAVSFMTVQINSFGTASVQFACYKVNGQSVSFESVPGSIVGGYTIRRDQYNCDAFIPKNDPNDTASPFSSPQNEAPNTVGLVFEYLITCLHILLSYYSAYRAWNLHQAQKTRSEFKTTINVTFFVHFVVWGTGNLTYMIVYSTALTVNNFFYIKSILTLTYFIAYFSFVLLVHYR